MPIGPPMLGFEPLTFTAGSYPSMGVLTYSHKYSHKAATMSCTVCTYVYKEVLLHREV